MTQTHTHIHTHTGMIVADGSKLNTHTTQYIDMIASSHTEFSTVVSVLTPKYILGAVDRGSFLSGFPAKTRAISSSTFTLLNMILSAVRSLLNPVLSKQTNKLFT